MNHWIDQSLKRWARWYQLRMLDKSMGWPAASPLMNFGMPPASGRRDAQVDDWSDCEWLHQAMRSGLSRSEFELLVAHYVQSGCGLRRTGKRIGVTHRTVRAWLEIVRDKVARLIGEKDCINKAVTIDSYKYPLYDQNS